VTPGPGLHVDVRQDRPIPLAAAFSCAPGEVLALVGPSGSGKSTLLRAIAGTYRPASGLIRVASDVWLDDRCCLPAHRRSVGMVFQHYALFPHMTALGNVVAAMGHVPHDKRESRARAILGLVNLGGLEARRPAELSGGQQQRVALARALAREPAVLLLDEPFAAVDKATRERLYREIAALRGVLNMPVVLVTHDLDEAMTLADRMTVLHHGTTLQTGTPDDITSRPVSAEVARLVGLRNLFEGTIAGPGLLSWRGRLLTIADDRGLAPGTAVPWLVPEAHVLPHRPDRPARGDRENPVGGTIVGALVIGPAVHLTLAPDEGGHPIHLSVPVHIARRNSFVPGAPLKVSLLAEGIHLMPAERG